MLLTLLASALALSVVEKADPPGPYCVVDQQLALERTGRARDVLGQGDLECSPPVVGGQRMVLRPSSPRRPVLQYEYSKLLTIQWRACGTHSVVLLLHTVGELLGGGHFVECNTDGSFAVKMR